MKELKYYLETVEKGITLAGVDANLCRTENEGQWNLKTKESEIWVDTWPAEEEQRVYFQVMSPIVAIPEGKEEAFYKEILELNYQIVGAYFVIYKQGAYLKFMKDAEHLIPDEVLMILTRVGTYSAAFTEGLIQKFGTQKLKHHD